MNKKNIKQIVFSGWHPKRWIALSAGTFFALQAISHSDPITGLLSFVLLFQAVTNTGCFGSKTCGVSFSEKETDSEISEITYTTIKE